MASQSGHLSVVQLLLGRSADIDVLNGANKTAVELASENDNAKVASFLAEYKLDVNVRKEILPVSLNTDEPDAEEDEKNEGKLSLHTASQEGEVDIVKMLLDQGADINAQNPDYDTPLGLAAAKGNLEVVRLLIDRGAE
ncbi:ankyrin repeat-containing domain protein, partial [Russula compacta]